MISWNDLHRGVPQSSVRETGTPAASQCRETVCDGESRQTIMDESGNPAVLSSGAWNTPQCQYSLSLLPRSFSS